MSTFLTIYEQSLTVTDMRPWLTPREAADILGVGRVRVMQLKKTGHLVCDYDINHRCQISRESVERYHDEETQRLAKTVAAGERRTTENADFRARLRKAREAEESGRASCRERV